jgi:SAM-dependent methyltransferase
MKKITPTNYEWLKDEEIKGTLQPVDVQGGGCMLINMKVFDWIAGPSYFEPEHIYGTDVQICRKIQEAGFEVWSDTSIELGHLRAQRMIVTGKNRREVLDYNKDKEDQVKAICNYGRMVNNYREDIKEFLGIDEKIASDKFIEYEAWQEHFEDYKNKDQWYIDSSETFLARQVAVNNPEKPFPAYGMVIESLKSGIDYNGLDFACGTAPLSYELAKMGHKVAFLDIPETKTMEFVKWRCEKGNLNGNAKFVSKLNDIDNDSLDYIIALDAIEHFEEKTAKSIIDEFAKKLKKGGILFCNFLTNISFEFPEHIFMDKGKFLEMTSENHLFPISHFIYMKDDTYFEAGKCKSA